MNIIQITLLLWRFKWFCEDYCPS